MRNAAPAGLYDLVARPHHVLPGVQLDLAGPGNTGQQFGDVDGARRERADRFFERYDPRVAHLIEPDRTCRDRSRVRILQPQDHALARRGRR